MTLYGKRGGQYAAVIPLNDETLMIRCRCTSSHFLSVWYDDDERPEDRSVYLEITAMHRSLRERVCDFFKRPSYTFDVLLDQEATQALVGHLQSAFIKEARSA